MSRHHKGQTGVSMGGRIEGPRKASRGRPITAVRKPNRMTSRVAAARAEKLRAEQYVADAAETQARLKREFLERQQRRGTT